VQDLPGIEIFWPEFVEFGGEERVILTLSRHLHDRGLPHSVLCYHDHIGLASYAEWPLELRELNPGPGGWRKSRALAAHLKTQRERSAPVPILFNIQSALHAGIAVRTPYHLRIPDTFSLLGPSGPSGLAKQFIDIARNAAVRRGIKRASAFITNTRALRDEMARLYGREAEVIYLGGLTADEPADAVRPATPPVQLLSVSRLQGSKHIDWIIDAVGRLRTPPKPPDVVVHIVGTGPDQARLQRLADERGLSELVTFHGFVSDEELDHLYRQAHVFLMPAKQGYGLPALEALNRGCAVVLNEESGVSEILGDTPSVAISAPSPDGFAAALTTMLERLTSRNTSTPRIPELPTEDSWADQLIKGCGWTRSRPKVTRVPGRPRWAAQ
jgi:glycosyltransferase involved in cell wall biosynthesis